MQWLQWPTGGKGFSVFRLEVTDRITSLASLQGEFKYVLLDSLGHCQGGLSIIIVSSLPPWQLHLVPLSLLTFTAQPYSTHYTAIQYTLHSHTVYITQLAIQ